VAKKMGIIRFLGTNCDADVIKWTKNSGYESEYIWFQDQFNKNDFEQIIIPGGFSYGDYLRCGAMAARSPVMKSVLEFTKSGKPVLGICNGFQILCEAGLLPGVLIRNESLKFKDEWAALLVQSHQKFFGDKMEKNQEINLPIAHGEGRFYHTADGLKKIQDQNQIWLKYKNNPNGALLNIAGIVSESGNVFGLMPHPERAVYSWMGSTDGQYFL
jgi:phosphoribosylformylglycinamidine synthase subunit PurQ / glutaminase